MHTHPFMLRVLCGALALSALPAFAGDVVIDVRLPARVSLGGEILADMYQPGVLRVERPEGQHALVVAVQGEPSRALLDVPEQGVVRALVTHEGITSTRPVRAKKAPDDAVPLQLDVHALGSSRLMLVADGKRHEVGPASPISVELAVGDHPITVRSHDGGVVYSRGVLRIRTGGEGLLQLVEGAAPRVSGEGVDFVATGD